MSPLPPAAPSVRASWTTLLAIALLYAGLGRLSLALAVPPGYSSPIWPPAGLALAAALVHGRRALPSILAGAFVVVTSKMAEGWGFGWRAPAMGLWVALGVTLQAAWSAELVRRWIGFPNELARGKDVVRFLLAAGPLGSLASATWSLPATLASGLVPARGALSSWSAWYCGDAIGALVFTPVVLVFMAEPRSLWRRRAGSVALPMGAAFAACALVYLMISRRDQQQIEAGLRREGVAMRHALEVELLSSRDVLRALQSHVDSVPFLDRHGFDPFAVDLIEHHAEIFALEWLPRVARHERREFEQAARDSGLAGYTIRELVDGQLVEAGERDEYFPIRLVEPRPVNESVLGLDVASTPERRDVLRRARAHDDLAVSAPLALAQTAARGVLMALPVHRSQELVGYVLAVLMMDDLLARSMQGGSGRLELALRDVTGPEPSELTEAHAGEPLDLTWSEELEFGGRRWELGFRAPHGLLAARPAWTAWLVLAGGMLLTSALGGLLLLVTGRTMTIEALAGKRASELLSKEEERARIQEQLWHSQKLEVVGRLAGGVAHDVNNLLTVIQGYGELLRAELESRRVCRALDEIDKATERAARVVQRLLAFARKQVLHPRPLAPSELVESLRGTLLPLLGERVSLRLDCHAQGTVLADPGQLEQVVMNLAVNARDALLPVGGELHLRVEDVELAEGDGAVPRGRHVRISVIDRGSGMAPEVLARIFEPFYTTKKEGTGLGLSTVYGIVQQSGGVITVESAPGLGSTFHVYLPRIESDLLVPVERKEHAPEAATGVVLVVEDEEALRSLLCSFLSARGHAVLVAQSAAEAVALARRHTAPIDLVLSDVVMPGLTGPEVVSGVRLSHPEAAVLYMSGYSGNALDQQGVAELGAQCLQKPFLLEELARRVQELIRNRRVAVPAA